MKTSLQTEPRRQGGGAALKVACLTPYQMVIERLAHVRERLFAEWRDLLATQEHVLRLTLNEAEALAWQTDVPYLVFPALAEEKIHAVARWNRHQQSMNSGR